MTKEPEQIDPAQVAELIGLNPDARQYFFAKADEKWLSWLWKHGLLDEIKRAAADSPQQGRIPELDYLARVAPNAPSEVVDIMQAVPCLRESFNPVVVSQFLWICGTLPADQLARMVPKVHDENWPALMSGFSSPAFLYGKLFKTLGEAKDFGSVVLLAEALLSLRRNDQQEPTSRRLESTFCQSDLSHTEVFSSILGVDDAHAVKALTLTVSALANTALVRGKIEGGGTFPIDDEYALLDVDFFTVEPDNKNRSFERDVRELAASAKVLAKRVIGENCEKSDFVRETYQALFKTLPEARLLWRLRLYVLSLCPEVFKPEIEEALFRIFDFENPAQLLLGPEYERLLQATFGRFASAEQRSYVTRVIGHFTEHGHKRDARDILSSIANSLTNGERRLAEAAFGPLIEDYVPRPSMGQVTGGTVVPRAPGTEEGWKRPVPEIVTSLKGEWAPSALKKEQTFEDFLHPIDAEGAADRLKIEVQARPPEFLQNAIIFFDRSHLHPHYTHAFLQGVLGLIAKPELQATFDFSVVLTLLAAIRESATERPFDDSKESKGDDFLAGWGDVHRVMADIIKAMLSGPEPTQEFSANREHFLSLINYLLTNGDPGPKDEEPETAKFKVRAGGDADWMIGDPFTAAINSVRGRAFEAFVRFADKDAQRIPQNEASKLATDTRALYEQTLDREKTRAIMFMFGRYLPSFYYRDTVWTQSLLPRIFPDSAEERHLSLAAWEGLLSAGLYREMFFDPEIQNLYERALTYEERDDAKRQHAKDPEEGLAEHLALAFMYFNEFGFDHPLFKAFWDEKTKKRQAIFVAFLGSCAISNRNERAAQFLKKEPWARKRLRKFWDWILSRCEDPDVLRGFESWIDCENDVLEVPWLAGRLRRTLEKTGGVLRWEYRLPQSIIALAKAAPEDTLAIARLHFIDGYIKARRGQGFFYLEDEWVDALRVLYATPITQSGVRSLVNDLVRDGGALFWRFKDIIV